MSDLADLIPALKRELAAPGDYDTTYPNSTDEDLLGRLADAFGLAQLDGYFPDQALDIEDFTVDPDLSAAGAALVVLYAGLQVIRSQLRAVNSSFRAKAGPVEYEVQKSAALLRDELKYLVQRRDELVTQSNRSSRCVFVYDGYLERAMVDLYGLGAFFDYELRA